MKGKLLFLTLNTFSATGGIEKVCRVMGKALCELGAEQGTAVSVFSMYDQGRQVLEQYIPSASFKGFGGNRLRFAWASLVAGHTAETIVLSHINLLPVACVVKFLFPKVRLVMVAHGIEVWERLSPFKSRMLRRVDQFLPVSAFTAGKLEAVHGVPPAKIQVLNNCLDPFLSNERNPALEASLRKKYGLEPDDFVLLTVTRLKFSEQYKGYDKVVAAVAAMKDSHPNLKYLIVGKWDAEEKARLDAIILQNGLQDAVVFAGFAKDEELAAHFHLSDAYIMPSTGEGFGVVFIEALFYGLPVIAGNVDGSVDALGKGELGVLVDPSNRNELTNAIARIYSAKNCYKTDPERLKSFFHFSQYKTKVLQTLSLSFKYTEYGSLKREFASTKQNEKKKLPDTRYKKRHLKAGQISDEKP